MSDSKFKMSRRESLAMLAGIPLAAAATSSMAMSKSPSEKPAVDFITDIDFKNPLWNRDTYARLDADLDSSKEKVAWLKGKVYGCRPNEKNRPLFEMEGFSVVKTKHLEDGSIRRMLRECVFYRDLETGELLNEWTNPYTNKTVKVVPIANDPFNFTISAYKPKGPSYGGLNKHDGEQEPFLLDWTESPNGTITLNTGIDLFYPNALQPEKWPLESAGSFNRVSEYFIYVFKRADAEDSSKTHIPAIGSWSRITPWLPWMHMGQADGFITYFSTFQTVPNIEALPQDMVEMAKAIDPKFLSAPTEDYGPSLSSLENYAREQTPAPVPEGYEPLETPVAPSFPGRG